MTDSHQIHATDIDLSAYLDAELSAPAYHWITAHLAVCPHCSSRLTAFASLSADFAQLPKESLGFDLAGVITGRLPASVPYHQPTPMPGWYRLLPVGIGASASFALGLTIGVLLFGGGAALPSVTAMSVFDPIPPGGLCLGLDSCYAKSPNTIGVTK